MLGYAQATHNAPTDRKAGYGRRLGYVEVIVSIPPLDENTHAP